MKWTKEQSKVIELRNSDILVSAAAGSGKTSVLVERIIRRVCDKDDPVDIDRILVVTFTNAAATEMKERIYKALKEASNRDPENERLKKQIALVFNAKISTIDAFCIYLIRNYFHETGVEPNMKIADAVETEEIKATVMRNLLEEYYTSMDETFLDFSDDYAKRDRDLAIEKMILTLFNESESYPYAEEFFEGQRAVYKIESKEDLSQKQWMQQLNKYTKKILAGVQSKVISDYEKLPDEEHPYAATLKSDLLVIEQLLGCSTYEDFYEGFANLEFVKAPTKKYPGEESYERKAIKDRRDAIKNEVKKLKELYVNDIERVYDDTIALKKRMDVLIDLACKFAERYKKEKEKRGIMEFSDAEHFALDILVDSKTKQVTESAKQLSREFAEVMVDEYQDSNLLQEIILSAVTAANRGGHNYFMVGDVKQSIYRFRQARPDIFMDKYLRYKEGEHDYETAIDLDSNFRSRKEVLYSTNALFEKVMKPDMGDVDYDEKATLKYMADYPEEGDYKSRVIVADSADAKELKLSSKDEYEAVILAMQIRKLVAEGKFTYSDIVILHRSANTVGSTFKEILKQFDIPAVVVNNTGYFSSVEVEVFLALLTVLANPKNDIPMAGVMKSVMFDFSDEQLAMIRLYDKNRTFFKNTFSIAKEEEVPENISEELFEKVRLFVETINRWRELAATIPVYKLMWQILSETGYDAYISALPEGDLRKENINMLIKMAVSYGENTSLREFVRYVAKLEKYDKQIPAAVGGTLDAVSIMTIHKSKGLEFPVVFLAGCGRMFNTNKDILVIGKDLGIATDLFDAKRRTKSETLIKNFISKKNYIDDLGEELRVLYVGMTRAKEQLFIVGVARGMEKLIEKSKDMSGEFTFAEKSSARSFIQWILPVALHRPDVFTVEEVGWKDVVDSEVANSINRDSRLSEIIELVGEVLPEEIAEFSKSIEYEYPREINTETKIKYSVSEIKRRAMEENLEEEERISVFSAESEESYVPLFISGKEHHISGAARGTAIHRYMECFDFLIEDRALAYNSEKERMEEKGLLKDDEAALLVEKEIKTFLASDLCERMHKAAQAGVLKKEAAFIMSGEEDSLIQGIIDVFFEEEDGMVLVDYKTDRVDNDASLVARYKTQMELYKQAIERTHQKEVKDMILYSFCLGREIYV